MPTPPATICITPSMLRTIVAVSIRMKPGNRGGPLFDLRGRMVGVTTWGYSMTEGLNFAIPVSTVKTFLANREAFAYDERNPNSGYRYPRPPRKGGRGDAPPR